MSGQPYPLKPKKWRYRDIDSKKAENLKKCLPNVPDSICTLLTQRGVLTYEAALRFFRPQLERDSHDPFLMKDMNGAVRRIQRAIANQEKVLIYSDYDVDGTTSATLLYRFFKDKLNGLECYIPDRFEEGYGISKLGVERAYEREVRLMIIADCGVQEVKMAAFAKSLGIDMIICDHHLPSGQIPEVTALLNPKQSNCPYPYKELSGCGVVLKLIQAFCKQENLPVAFWEKYLDLVVTSIAADIVPITGENRLLSFFGLKKWNENPAHSLTLFIKDRKSGRVGISDIVFGIAPLINAAGRISHAKEAVSYLTADTADIAEETYDMLKKYNQKRKELQDEILNQALQQIEGDVEGRKASVIVVYGKWNKGVVGIVASKLIEIFYKPTLVLAQDGDFYVGSGRSIGNYDLHKSLKHCSQLLEKFGGHHKAVGLKIKKNDLPSFIEQLRSHISATLPAENLREEIWVDAPLPLHKITAKFLRLHEQLGPFGPDNMRPVFLAKKIKIKSGTFRTLGSDGLHIKFFVYENDPSITFEVIGFHMKDKAKMLQETDDFDMLFSIDQRVYRGEFYLNLQARDFAITTE